MRFHVGDRVLVDIPDPRNSWFQTMNGRIYRVTEAMEGGVYKLSDAVGYDYTEDLLVPVELPIKVSVEWDLTKDLSISQAQYERICRHADLTGRTTTGVLRMLVAAGMVLLTEDTTC